MLILYIVKSIRTIFYFLYIILYVCIYNIYIYIYSIYIYIHLFITIYVCIV